MPIYEYLCEPCKGIFEAVKPMREAADITPCPVCDEDSERVMPSSFTAFVMRKGYPRRIPDRGTFWHLGEEVTYLPNVTKPNEHPQVTKHRRKEPLSKGERANRTESRIVQRRAQRVRMREDRLRRKDVQSRVGKDFPPRVQSR